MSGVLKLADHAELRYALNRSVNLLAQAIVCCHPFFAATLIWDPYFFGERSFWVAPT